MKHEDLLEVMGEIDPQYIEDAVRGSHSPKLLLRRLSPYAGGAAAVLILGFSAFVIYGVIRDGIAQQNPPAGYTETAASLSGTELTQSAGTETGTAAETEGEKADNAETEDAQTEDAEAEDTEAKDTEIETKQTKDTE